MIDLLAIFVGCVAATTVYIYGAWFYCHFIGMR